MEDYFENVPDIVIDKILEKLPIRMAAWTSVVSKQWRRAWLSLKILVFDYGFWMHFLREEIKGSQVISDILFYHNGPVSDFYLYNSSFDACMNHSRWISFLSKNGVRKIEMRNGVNMRDITSHIFRCSEIVHLKLFRFWLNHPPTDFKGFPNLTHFEIENISFKEEKFVGSLIKNCRKLETLKLVNCIYLNHIVIDAPSLQTLILEGDFESLAFRNLYNLKSILIHLDTMPEKIASVETVDGLNLLASSCQLQSIKFNGYFCKFLAAGGIISSTSVTFNYLDELCLSDLNLSNFDVYRYLLSMIECCPKIKKLDISLIPGENVAQHALHFNYNYKLDHLREVKIKDITRSNVELKLVEYVLAISPSLENLSFQSGACDNILSQLKMSRALMRFPRASPKASLVCLDT